MRALIATSWVRIAPGYFPLVRLTPAVRFSNESERVRRRTKGKHDR
jgi:hypothetical protein